MINQLKMAAVGRERCTLERLPSPGGTIAVAHHQKCGHQQIFRWGDLCIPGNDPQWARRSTAVVEANAARNG